MTLRVLLEFKLTPSQRIINKLSELKWKMIKGKEANKDVDSIIDLIDLISKNQKENEPKLKDIQSFAKKYDISVPSKLDEKFDMKSSLENSIIGWKVALKKTSCSKKQKHLKTRIQSAEKKLAEISTNSK